jgi:hypothetical protein
MKRSRLDSHHYKVGTVSTSTTTRSSASNVIVRLCRMFATLIISSSKRFTPSVAVAFSIVRNNNYSSLKITFAPAGYVRQCQRNVFIFSKFPSLPLQRRHIGNSAAVSSVSMYVENVEEIDDATFSTYHQSDSSKNGSNDICSEATTKLFEVTAEYQPAGDQPEAIRKLSEYIDAGHKFSILQGITGTGKCSCSPFKSLEKFVGSVHSFAT